MHNKENIGSSAEKNPQSDAWKMDGIEFHPLSNTLDQNNTMPQETQNLPPTQDNSEKEIQLEDNNENEYTKEFREQFLNEIITCDEDKIEDFVNQRIEKLQKEARPDETIGVVGISNHPGFIGDKTDIKFENYSLSSYKIKSIDYLKDFVKQIRQSAISKPGNVMSQLNNFMIQYFTDDSKHITKNREDVLLDHATYDEEGFPDCSQCDISNLKGQNAAMCTEYTAMAQNVLTFFGFDSTFCTGTYNDNHHSEHHAFNVVIDNNNQPHIVDFSMPTQIFNIRTGHSIQQFYNSGILSEDELARGQITKPDYSRAFNGREWQTIKLTNKRTYTFANPLTDSGMNS